MVDLKGLVDAIFNINSCIPLTSPLLEMETKKRRQPKGTMIIGKGAATVKIYPFIRKNGYKQNNVCGTREAGGEHDALLISVRRN